jgi:hypothetical protein
VRVLDPVAFAPEAGCPAGRAHGSARRSAIKRDRLCNASLAQGYALPFLTCNLERDELSPSRKGIPKRVKK